MKYEIEISEDDLEAIIIKDLQKNLGYTTYGQLPPIFSFDEDEEMEQIALLRNAFKIVLEYYGVRK